jgi:HSP20 family protein
LPGLPDKRFAATYPGQVCARPREFEAEDYPHRERRRSDISRAIPLPENIDEDEVSATYEGGVLTVTLPKAQADTEDGHWIPSS